VVDRRPVGSGGGGVIGGAPKSCKSWLALEMAVMVASGRLCLGRYEAGEAGPALMYAAEDAPAHVRERVEHLARARGADFDSPALKRRPPGHKDPTAIGLPSGLKRRTVKICFAHPPSIESRPSNSR
jgi:hypothetical protein